jgi:hypothetical protein
VESRLSPARHLKTGFERESKGKRRKPEIYAKFGDFTGILAN